MRDADELAGACRAMLGDAGPALAPRLDIGYSDAN
jgi:hypothetical protein